MLTAPPPNICLTSQTVATTRTGTVTLEDWRRVQKRNPGVLLPIVQARRRLVNAFMGPRFWHDRSEERFRIFEDIDQPGFIILDMLDAVVTKRLLGLTALIGSPRSTDHGEEEEQDPHEADFETPREEAREEAYHHDMAMLIHEKRRIAQSKKTVLQKGKEAAEAEAAKIKAEAQRLKEEAERLKEEAVKMRHDAALKLKAEALRLKAEATQAAERLKRAATEKMRGGGEEDDDEEEDDEDEDELNDDDMEGMFVAEYDGVEEEEEDDEGPPVQQTGDWWTTIEERRPTPPQRAGEFAAAVEEGDGLQQEEGSSRPGSRAKPELLLIGEDVADVIRDYYSVKAEGLSLLESVSETETTNIGQQG